jgi:hypothetical protein
MNLLASPFLDQYVGCSMRHPPPRAVYRGFMLDSARCQENRSYYRKAMDFACVRGMNVLLWHFTDDQGCSLELNVPGIASPNAYSKKEMRELVAYARDRGIEVVPELASLGHCRYLTRLPAYRHLNEADAYFTGMCPVSDETRTVIRQLIEETAEVFDSPNFHVGMDEVNIGEHELTRAALRSKTRGDLLADYTLFLHGIVTGLGRRLWMWGDGVLKHAEMRRCLPRDIVVCNWQYQPDASPAPSQTLLDAGFDVVLCSALISHDQPLFPGKQFAEPNLRTLESQKSLCTRQSEGLIHNPVDDVHSLLSGRLTGARFRRSNSASAGPPLNEEKQPTSTGTCLGQCHEPDQSRQTPGKILGHITTIWTPVRFIANSLWVGIDLAAAILREGPDVDSATQASRFGQSFHGLSGSDLSRFTDAVLLLIEHSPTRQEWLAVAKLKSLSPAMLNRIMAATAAWSEAQDLLIRVSPAVTDHRHEYRAFALLIETLAHTYAVAAYVAGGAPSLSTLQEMTNRWQAIIHEIDLTWDLERFADDPRKFTAPIASFQDDHLLPLLQKGLAALQKKLEESGAAAILAADVSPESAVAEISAA